MWMQGFQLWQRKCSPRVPSCCPDCCFHYSLTAPGIVWRWHHHRHSPSRLLRSRRDLLKTINWNQAGYSTGLHIHLHDACLPVWAPRANSIPLLRLHPGSDSPPPLHPHSPLQRSKQHNQQKNSSLTPQWAHRGKDVDPDRERSLMPHCHSNLQHISSPQFPHPHSITTNYMQFNYYGAGALLFISWLHADRKEWDGVFFFFMSSTMYTVEAEFKQWKCGKTNKALRKWNVVLAVEQTQWVRMALQTI